jgi:hypothetical protein
MSKIQNVQKGIAQQSDFVNVTVSKISLMGPAYGTEGDAIIGYFNNDERDDPNRWFGVKVSDTITRDMLNYAYDGLARNQNVTAGLVKRRNDNGWDISFILIQ